MNPADELEALRQQLAALEATLRATQAAQHDAEVRYRTLVEQIPAITYIVDVQGDIGTTIYISPRVEDILGYTPAEWLADPDLWIKLLHPVDHDHVLAEVVRQNTTGVRLRLTYRSLTRDGRVVWFQNQSTSMPDENGRPRYTHGVMLDITERKEAERALHRYKVQLEKEVAERTAELTRAQQETAARTAELTHAHEELAERTAQLTRAHQELAERTIALNRAHQGLANLRPQLPTLQVALRTAEDAYHQAETQRQTAEARYRTLVEQLPAITYIVEQQGAGGITIYIGPRVQDILGYTPAEWLADAALWQKLLHPADREYVLAEVARHNALHTPLNLTYRSFARDGRVVWFQNQATLLADPDGQTRYTHGVMLDITERKQAEQELEQYKTHLEEQVAARMTELHRANRELAALNRVTQTITGAHDLPAMLKIVARELVGLFDARNSGITLLDAARTHLTVVADHSHDPTEGSAVGIVIPLAGNASSLYVVETGRSLVIPQAQTNPLTATIHPLMRARHTECLMIAPLLARGEVIGTIGVDTDDPHREFAAPELTLMETIAGQIAGAIENARLFETERTARQQAERLQAATTVLSSTLLPEQVVERILAELQQVVPYHSASVQVLTPTGHLRIVGGVGLPNLSALMQIEIDPQHTEIPNTTVLRTLAPFIVSDVSQYPDFYRAVLAGQAPIHAWLGVPLLFGDRLIGMLALDHREVNFYTPAQAQVALAFAAQAATALENARLFAEAQHARAAAEAANQTKSLFLSSVSHELRTPLTSVLGFTRIIQKRLDEVILPTVTTGEPKVARAVQQVRENLSIILAEGERLTQMINDVLDLAKIEAGKVAWQRQPVRLDDLITRAVTTTRPLFDQKGLALVCQLPSAATVPTLLGDEARLLQVLVNLLSNAVKFTAHGAVTCTLTVLPTALQVQVQDTGVGIAPADLPRVFEAFVQVGDTLTDKPHGTGLGLPICQQIIAHHGGRIWAESAGVSGHGSTFIFTLPLPPAEPEPHA